MTTNIYSNEWLDQVFEKRNKNYGAYYLRAHADDYTVKGLFIASSLVIALFVLPVLASVMRGDVPLTKLNGEHTLAVVDMPVTIPPTPEIIKPQSASAAPKLRSDLFKPIIVSDETPIDKDEHKDLLNSANNNPNAILNGTGLITDTATGTGTGNGLSLASIDTTIYRGGVEIMPQFPGGESALMHYLQSNLKYPRNLIEDKITGTVYLSFIVNKDGDVTGIDILRGVRESKDFENEAKRVVAMMPKWKPGRQNGQNVNVYFMLPISFSLR